MRRRSWRGFWQQPALLPKGYSSSFPSPLPLYNDGVVPKRSNTGIASHGRFILQYDPMTEELKALRWRYKDLSIKPEIMRVFTNRYVAPQVARLLTAIHDHPEGVRNMLRTVKRVIALEVHDLTPTRYFLTTKVVCDQLMLSFETRAREVYSPDSPQGFICLWDTAHGIDKALLPIAEIIRELHGETNYREKLKLDPGGTADPPIFHTTNFNEYQWAKLVVDGIDTITKEPSGYSLLDQSVAWVHENYTDRRHGQLVVAGAEVGQKIYKALYPLTEGI
jgi:hypothetical protein